MITTSCTQSSQTGCVMKSLVVTLTVWATKTVQKAVTAVAKFSIAIQLRRGKIKNSRIWKIFKCQHIYMYIYVLKIQSIFGAERSAGSILLLKLKTTFPLSVKHNEDQQGEKVDPTISPSWENTEHIHTLEDDEVHRHSIYLVSCGGPTVHWYWGRWRSKPQYCIIRNTGKQQQQ